VNAPLSVHITGAEPGKGKLAASLFSSEEDFLSRPMLLRRAAVNASGFAVLDFGPLPAGSYAVAAYWDEDDDGEMDTGFLRIPKEKVGFSNNARGRLGPASWEAARFEHGDQPLEIRISVSKARD
jgi:uncharacterized protein (DUF2141 family)